MLNERRTTSFRLSAVAKFSLAALSGSVHHDLQ
jgi:hypothetical protein